MTSRVGTGPGIADARGTLLENDQSLLYLDTVRQSLMRIDLRNGNRSVASSHEAPVGTGPALDTGVDMVLDTRSPSPGSRALVLTGIPDGAVIAVDLATGNRTPLAALGNAIGLHQPRSLVLDAANDRVLILDNDNFVSNFDGLYAMNLTTGAVTTVSDGLNVGTGAGFGLPVDLVLEPATNPTRVLVSQVAQSISGGAVNGPNILSIDLATGVRSVFSAASGAPGGIALPLPTFLYLDAANARLLGLNGYPSNLYQIPLDTRVRGLISGAAVSGDAGTGGGFQAFGQNGLDVDPVRGVAYTFSENRALMAIDLVSGDRVLVSH